MESNSSTQLKVGFFLTIGIGFILGSIFFLGADKALFSSFTRIHAHFDQVQGLASGSVVSLSGITVGNVESITFLPDKNSLNVTMKINQEFIPRLGKGSLAEIRTQGALGDKYIFITPSESSTETVKEGDILEVAKAKDLMGIISERGSETNRIFDIINELHKITLAINSDNRLGRIMGQMEAASSSLGQASRETQKLVTQLNNHNSGDKLGTSLQRLDTILTKIEKGEGSLGALINDPSLHNQLKSLLGGDSRRNQIKSLMRTSIEKGD